MGSRSRWTPSRETSGPPVLAPLAGDLVDLVDEDDAVVLDPVERLVHHVVHVHQLLELLVHQDAAGLGHLDRAPLLPAGQHVLQHLGEVDVGPFHALGRLHQLHHREALGRDLDLDLAVVELAVDQHLPQLLARPLRRSSSTAARLRPRLAAAPDDEHRRAVRGRRSRRPASRRRPAAEAAAADRAAARRPAARPGDTPRPRARSGPC